MKFIKRPQPFIGAQHTVPGTITPGGAIGHGKYPSHGFLAGTLETTDGELLGFAIDIPIRRPFQNNMSFNWKSHF